MASWVFWYLFLDAIVLFAYANRKVGSACFADDMVQCETRARKTLSFKVTCVHQRNICDMVSDCEDGEDEMDCVDTTGDDHGVVSMLNNRVLEPEEFNKCLLENPPDFCNCRRDTRLSCQFAGLQEIPRTLDQDVTHLLVGYNNITLNANSFQVYKYLQYVQLNGNNLTALPAGLFRGNNLLIHLLLSNNLLTTIPCDVGRNLNSMKNLFMNDNRISDIDFILECLSGLNELHVNSNFVTLENREMEVYYPNLKVLSAEDNLIKTLTNNSFRGMDNLNALYLRNNKIQYIAANTFSKLTQLATLDLSYNRLQELRADMFYGLTSVAIIEIKDNEIVTMEENTFSDEELPNLNTLNMEGMELGEDVLENLAGINVSHIHFKRFRYCSYVSQIRDCRPKTDGVSSFDQLLVHVSLRAAVWKVSAITIIGNLVVLHGRAMARDDNKVVSLFIRNLAVADLLTGCYLLVIAIKDQVYRDNYYLHAFEWMNSVDCTVTGIVGLLASEVSVLLLTVMSVERCLSIIFPLKAPYLNSVKVKYLLALLWIIGAIIALIPVGIYTRRPRFYGSNGMCLPLHLDDPWVPGWKYSAIIFVGVNQIGMIAIIVSYGAMFYSIRRTRANTPLAVGEREFALRFFFIVLTDCLCWIPIIILKILALLDHQISPGSYAFVAVILLPINSAINPWIYTFTTSKFRSQISRYTRNWKPRFSRADSETEVTRMSFIKSSKKMSLSARDSISVGPRYAEVVSISGIVDSSNRNDKCTKNDDEDSETSALNPDHRV